MLNALGPFRPADHPSPSASTVTTSPPHPGAASRVFSQRGPVPQEQCIKRELPGMRNLPQVQFIHSFSKHLWSPSCHTGARWTLGIPESPPLSPRKHRVQENLHWLARPTPRSR